VRCSKKQYKNGNNVSIGFKVASRKSAQTLELFPYTSPETLQRSPTQAAHKAEHRQSIAKLKVSGKKVPKDS